MGALGGERLNWGDAAAGNHLACELLPNKKAGEQDKGRLLRIERVDGRNHDMQAQNGQQGAG